MENSYFRNVENEFKLGGRAAADALSKAPIISLPWSLGLGSQF